MSYLVHLLLNLDYVFLQLLGILNPRFELEELFYLGLQHQKTAVQGERLELLFEVGVLIHDCRLVDPVGNRVSRREQREMELRGS